MQHHSERQQLAVILLIVFTSFVGTSITYPIFPPLFLNESSNSIIPLTYPNSSKGILLGIALAAYPFGQFIGAPIIGNYSDRYGRKYILIITLFGAIIGYFLTAISLHLNFVAMLVASRFFSGVMESNFVIARAMTDEFTHINKYKSLGRINAMAAIGYVLGPLIGGFLSDSNIVSWFSYPLPLYVAMILACCATVLAILMLQEQTIYLKNKNPGIIQQFHLISRFHFLMKQCPALKQLILLSTLFTLSVDIFYEFGPIYLTSLWSMSSGSIAIYSALLATTLAIGSAWLSYRLSLSFSVRPTIITAMLMTGIMLGLMVIYPNEWLSLLLFALLGLSISTVNTHMLVGVSASADKNIQGEAMGFLLGLRMLGDSLICIIGGLLIVSSALIPIAISSGAAFLAAIICAVYIKDKECI